MCFNFWDWSILERYKEKKEKKYKKSIIGSRGGARVVGADISPPSTYENV